MTVRGRFDLRGTLAGARRDVAGIGAILASIAAYLSPTFARSRSVLGEIVTVLLRE